MERFSFFVKPEGVVGRAVMAHAVEARIHPTAPHGIPPDRKGEVTFYLPPGKTRREAKETVLNAVAKAAKFAGGCDCCGTRGRIVEVDTDKFHASLQANSLV